MNPLGFALIFFPIFKKFGLFDIERYKSIFVSYFFFKFDRNQKSADFLGLNLEEYSNEFHKLVTETYKITEDILITSPNDFNGLKDYLEKKW